MDAPSKIGRYEIIDRVGRGAMGVLYRGRDPVLEREVAIKVMSADFLSDEQARPRFYREARAAAKLQHRNIVTVFEFAEDGDTPYIVMEFLRGQSLADCIKNHALLDLDRKIDIVVQLCTGLQFAHEQGVVHRDVKPANIWLLEDAGVKLLDFGIAKIGSSTFTMHGDVMGSASYMSPEQISGKVVDGRSDVFAAGVVLYELLSGRKPFEGDSATATIMKIMDEEPPGIETVVSDIPPALVSALHRALEKDPDRRYATAGDFAAELRLARLMLQTSGDTVLGDLDMGETMYAPLPGDDGKSSTLQVPRTTLPAAKTAVQTARSTTRAAAQHVLPIPVWVAVAGVLVVASAVLAATFMLRGSEQTVDLETGTPVAEQTTPGPSAPPRVDPPVATAPVLPAVLKIASVPPGASINIDGRDTGLVTPADLPIGNPPPSKLRLSRAGYQNADTDIDADVLQKGSMSVQLSVQERPVVVEFSGSYPFQIADGRKVISAASASHTLKVSAPRMLRMVASEYLLDRAVRVEPSGNRAEFSAPELGQISLRVARETCSVSIGGRDFGFPPIPTQTLASGTYSVELKCPDGRNQRIQVPVPAGSTRVEVIR